MPNFCKAILILMEGLKIQKPITIIFVRSFCYVSMYLLKFV